MALFNKLATYWRLGPFNVASVAAYRFKIKLGYFKRLLPIEQSRGDIDSGDFFTISNALNIDPALHPVTWQPFGWLSIDQDTQPNWHASIFDVQKRGNGTLHWSDISDFDEAVGDIKTLWEASRFSWLLPFSVDFLRTGEVHHLDKINTWLKSWQEANPANQGINWKCGQEASIRVLHLAATSFLLSQHKTITKALSQTLEQHVRRIAPTIGYAKAQDNNHGTSEACALICGALLLKYSPHFNQEKQANNWLQLGRSALENRVKKLIADDGCFSQNSVNYHRLMLDTVSLTEFFRQEFQQDKFSKTFYRKIKLATLWLADMVVSDKGEAPILGLNDGAQLLPTTPCDYTDFRPSVVWAKNLFIKSQLLDIQHTSHQLASLFPARAIADNHEINHTFTSDYHALRRDKWQVYLRTPTSTFRPAQCDALHIDAWYENENILISTGSYSYNCEAKWQNYFPSVVAQNTVQFDQREQMPRLSRFLYSHWIKTQISTIKNGLSAYYRNHYGHSHKRTCSVVDGQLTVTDFVAGFNKHAVVRWHLKASDWKIIDNKVSNGQWHLAISGDVPITHIKLVEGWQSRYYLKKQPVSVMEITIEQPGTITTVVSKH